MFLQTSYKTVFTLLFVLKAFVQASPRFEIVHSNSDSLKKNVIHFQCRDSTTSLLYDSALFWLNGTNLSLQTDVFNVGSGEIAFQITRQLEGSYTCGRLLSDGQNREESAPLVFVAYPEFNSTFPTEIVEYEESGTTARLECAIKPGVLTTEYFVTWKDATSGDDLINLVAGSLQFQFRTDERFTITQNDFSLLIEDVRPSDAGTYLCVLGVRGADRFNVPKKYDQTKTINITLQVFDPPMITDPPQPVRVALPDISAPATGPDVTYSCTATATVSSVELLWRHNEVDVTRDSNKYSTNVLPPEYSNGLTHITVELTIQSPKISDSGTVQCIARIPPRVDTDNKESIASADTTLSVLGGFSNMVVSITDDGGVLYDLELLQGIPTDVRLRLEYTDANDEANQMNITTGSGFVNTTSILSVVRTPPFQVFQVRVALATPDLAVIGPFHPRTQTLDVRNTPLTRDELIGTVVAVCFGAFLIVIFVTIVILICYVKKYRTTTFNKKRAGKVAEDITLIEVKQNEKDIQENGDGIIKRIDHADRYVEIFTKIYKGYTACDTDEVHEGQEGNEIQRIDDGNEAKVQEEKVGVQDVLVCLDKVMGYGLQLEQSDEFKKRLTENIQKIHKKDKTFVIETFKIVFSSVYSEEEVIGQEKIKGEELELLVKFVEATLAHVQKEDYVEHFTPVISPFVPNHAH